MRIGIDARFFGPQETGIGRYVERLIRHLALIDTRHEYVVFLRQRAFDWWTPPNERWSKVLADIHWYGLEEQRRMPGIFRRQHLDLLHVPHFNVPLFTRQRFVVTIHDLILDEFPTERSTTLEPLLFAMKFQAYKAVVNHAIRQSQAIITVSEYSRSQLLKRFSLDQGKVHVTYESVDPIATSVPWQQIAEHGVRQPYILHVGNSYPHKNLDRLLEAMEQLQQRGSIAQLVVVGKNDYFSQRLQGLAQQKNLRNVLFFGFASDQELAALYEHATAYVFPSLSEGFGLPGLEAMQAGVPVLAAKASCLPEVFGKAAEYFDPLNSTSIAYSIERVLRDTLLRQQLIAAGRDQLAKYSWRRMAEETLAIYEQTLPHASS